MPGCWEIPQSVLVGILHTDNTTLAWSFGLRNLIIPGQILPVAGMPYDMSRNVICQATLEHGFDWCFHYDSDVVPPRDAILKLMSRNQPIISGVYCRRSPPHSIPVMQKNGNWVTEYPPNAIIEVDVVGAGCLLIHRSVLERFKQQPQRPGKTWFDWRVDMQGFMAPELCKSEDFCFCDHSRKLGYKVLVDTSIQCRHIGLGEATLGQFLPCNTNTIT